MKHEITNTNTKRKLAASLKNLMKKKSLDKISISEIIVDSALNRKTFYYHFRDVPSLFLWMLKEDAKEYSTGTEFLVAPEETVSLVLDFVKNTSYLKKYAYDSHDKIYLKSFFFDCFATIIGSMLEAIEDASGAKTDTSFKAFVNKFYAEAVAGMLTDYFRFESEETRLALIRDILFILENSLPAVIAAKCQEGKV